MYYKEKYCVPQKHWFTWASRVGEANFRAKYPEFRLETRLVGDLPEHGVPVQSHKISRFPTKYVLKNNSPRSRGQC